MDASSKTQGWSTLKVHQRCLPEISDSTDVGLFSIEFTLCIKIFFRTYRSLRSWLCFPWSLVPFHNRYRTLWPSEASGTSVSGWLVKILSVQQAGHCTLKRMENMLRLKPTEGSVCVDLKSMSLRILTANDRPWHMWITNHTTEIINYDSYWSTQSKAKQFATI